MKKKKKIKKGRDEKETRHVRMKTNDYNQKTKENKRERKRKG